MSTISSETVKITIDGEEQSIPKAEFVTIVSAARFQLNKLQELQELPPLELRAKNSLLILIFKFDLF